MYARACKCQRVWCVCVAARVLSHKRPLFHKRYFGAGSENFSEGKMTSHVCDDRDVCV